LTVTSCPLEKLDEGWMYWRVVALYDRSPPSGLTVSENSYSLLPVASAFPVSAIASMWAGVSMPCLASLFARFACSIWSPI